MHLKKRRFKYFQNGPAHIKYWILFSFIHGTVARTLEGFKANYCEESSHSFTLLDLSYFDCVEECKARDECTGANFRPLLDTCVLNLGSSSPATSGCDGVQYSRKDDWIMVRRS